MEDLLALIENQPNNTEARMKLVKKYIDTNDYESAKVLLEDVLNIEPDHLDANYIMSQMNEFEEDFLSAIEHLEKVVKQRPTYELIYKLGQLYESADKYENAIALYKECFNVTPEDPNIIERVAHVNRILGNIDEAIDFYNKLLKLQADNIVALSQLTELYEGRDKLLFRVTKAKLNEAEGSLAHALAEYRKAISEAEAPEDVAHIRNSIAKILVKQGNYLKAIDEYQHILDVDKDNHKIYKSLAEAYMQVDNQTAAAEAYERALEIFPDDDSAMKELVDIYLEEDEAEKALPLLERLIVLDMSNISHHNNMARVYIAKQEDEKALDKLNYVLAKDPKNVEALGILVDFNIIKEDYETALSYADQIKQIIPKSPFGYKKAGEIYELMDNDFEAHYNLGTYHDLKGEKQLAIDEYTWALEKEPDNSEIVSNLAKLYEEIGEEYIAIEYYQKALIIDSSDIQALHKMSEIYKRKKDYDHAISTYNYLLEMAPESKEVMFYLASAYETVKNYELAIESYNKYLELAPYSPKSKEARQKIEQLQSREDEIVQEEGLLDKLLGFFKKK